MNSDINRVIESVQTFTCGTIGNQETTENETPQQPLQMAQNTANALTINPKARTIVRVPDFESPRLNRTIHLRKQIESEGPVEDGRRGKLTTVHDNFLQALNTYAQTVNPKQSKRKRGPRANVRTQRTGDRLKTDENGAQVSQRSFESLKATSDPLDCHNVSKSPDSKEQQPKSRLRQKPSPPKRVFTKA